MKNFATYERIMLKQGCTIEKKFNTRPHLDDFVYDGDVLVIPKNVTCFSQITPNGNKVEFIVCADAEYEELKKVYVSWLCRPNSKGNMIDELREFGDLNAFFAQNEGRKFKVHIIKNEELLDGFGRPLKTYRFTWVNK